MIWLYEWKPTRRHAHSIDGSAIPWPSSISKNPNSRSVCVGCIASEEDRLVRRWSGYKDLLVETVETSVQTLRGYERSLAVKGRNNECWIGNFVCRSTTKEGGCDDLVAKGNIVPCSLAKMWCVSTCMQTRPSWNLIIMVDWSFQPAEYTYVSL